MKNSILTFIFLFSILSSFINCSNDDASHNTTPEAEYSEIEFAMDFFNDPISTKATNDCPTNEYLQELAYNSQLYINLTINNVVHSARITKTTSKYISDAVLLKAGDYIVSEATITTADNEILFSAVNEGSKYQNYVPSLLPIKFSIGDNGSFDQKLPLYEKSTLDIHVLCVADKKPADFGFLKWNVHYTKLYCVPFIINHCDDLGEDFVASGTITVKNGRYNTTTGLFTQANAESEEFKNWAYIDDTKNIISGGELTSLCFADNYDIDNQTEYYQITLNLTYPVVRTIVGYANVSMLEQYNNIANEVWEQDINALHFNFCKGKTWFFPLGTEF